VLVFARQKIGVDGDERGGKRALAEHVLQEIRNSKSRVESISGEGNSEVVTEHPLPDHANDATYQNSGADHERKLPGLLALCLLNCGRAWKAAGARADYINSLAGYFSDVTILDVFFLWLIDAGV
jgi:hypothetical protein